VELGVDFCQAVWMNLFDFQLNRMDLSSILAFMHCFYLTKVALMINLITSRFETSFDFGSSKCFEAVDLDL